MSSTRPRAANASATASITAGSQPSETFGTDSSRATDLLYGAGVSHYRSIRALQRDLANCRRCLDAGYPIESKPVVHGTPGKHAFLYGQAPGIVEGAKGAPWRGRAGRTLRRWLELDEETFYATFYCASVTRCYPGRTAGGRGDRTPTPAERRLCAPWRDEEMRLLQPDLIITVGGLAAQAIIGAKSLTECVGKSY